MEAERVNSSAATPSSPPEGSSTSGINRSKMEEWASQTVMGTFAGMFYGGFKSSTGEGMATGSGQATTSTGSGHATTSAGNGQATTSTGSGQAASATTGSSGPVTGRQSWAAARERNERMFLRVARGSIVGGAQLGLFTGVFGGAKIQLGAWRGKEDMWNTVMAGSGTAMAFGLALPGPLPARITRASMGGFLGVLICAPLGLLETLLQPTGGASRSGNEDVPATSEDDSPSLGAAIERIGRSHEMTLQYAAQQSQNGEAPAIVEKALGENGSPDSNAPIERSEPGDMK